MAKAKGFGLITALVIAVISFFVLFFFFPDVSEKYFSVSYKGEVPEELDVGKKITEAASKVTDQLVDGVSEAVSKKTSEVTDKIADSVSERMEGIDLQSIISSVTGKK